jgi:hypothetical protein
MCFGMILQTQGNAGTAFLRRLAIQFSKTEPHPSIREPALEPSPDRRGVAKTAVLRQGRTALLPAPSRVVKRKVRNRVPSCLRDVRESISTSTRLAPSSLPGDPDRFTVPTRGALLLTPRGPRRQLPGKTSTSRTTPVRLSAAGASSTRAPPRRQENPEHLRLLPPGLSSGEGASFTRDPRGCQQACGRFSRRRSGVRSGLTRWPCSRGVTPFAGPAPAPGSPSR